MKKYGILLVAGLVLAAMVLVSCGDKDNPLGIQKGGTLTIKNTLQSEQVPIVGGEMNKATVTISKAGLDLTLAPKPEDTLFDDEIIEPGKSRDFKVTEDGLYRVDWSTPLNILHIVNLPQTATLVLGGAATVELGK